MIVKNTYTLIVAILLLCLCKANATHIVGGEIYYDNLGGNNYKISMKVYRDCINGVPQLDNPAFITIFDVNNTVVTTLQMPLLSTTTVPPSNNSPCAPNTVNTACVQQGLYEITVNLPPKIGGYTIAYQRCCRNNTILNLVNPGNVGSTYFEHIPGPDQVAVNSSPRFTNRPPIYICANVPIAFNHVATDPDGDSLVYSLCSPFNGLDPCCPIVSNPPQMVSGGSQCTNPPPSCPSFNTLPPYVSVPFVAPYSSSYPLASSPAININSNNGFLNGKPTILGQWVVGVCVSEYRNGVLIGVHHRDFQFNVINCPAIVVADIVPQIASTIDPNNPCQGLTIAYLNNSGPDTTQLDFHWDFGDPSTLADTSNQTQVSYTYPNPGTYTVTLIANPGSLCADTTFEVFKVYPLLAPEIIQPNAQCFNGNSFNFNGGGTFQSTGTFAWNFGPNASPQTANTASVTGVSFNAPGFYNVLFTVSENSCTATTSKTIEVVANPVAIIGPFNGLGCDPMTVTFPNLSTAGDVMNFLWTFSDGTTSTEQFPTHTFSPVGVYGATLQVSTAGKCVDTSQVSAVNSITVNPSPLAGFIATPTITTIFDPDISFFNQASFDVVSWYYDFADGNNSTNSNPFHSYAKWGDYEVEQTVTNNFGCTDKARLLIKILPEFRFWIPNAYTPRNNDGLNDVFKPIIFGVEDYSFLIFNRWGQLIYKTNDTEQGWNGTFKGKDSPFDVYVWKIEFKNIVSKENEEHVGHVTLVR